MVCIIIIVISVIILCWSCSDTSTTLTMDCIGCGCKLPYRLDVARICLECIKKSDVIKVGKDLGYGTFQILCTKCDTPTNPQIGCMLCRLKETHKKCPYCCEHILKNAIICIHCRKEWTFYDECFTFFKRKED